MDPRIESVMAQLQRVVNQVLLLNKKSLFIYRGVEFYPSEVHLMLVIADGNDTNATRMAEELGITKGAISQALSRLERKDVLTKSKDASNKNELTLTFTPFGAEVVRHYRDLTAGAFDGPRDYLGTLSEDQRQAVQGFLSEVEGALERVPD